MLPVAPILNERFDWHGAAVRWSRFGTGRPVVLCHGTPWSSYVWRSLVPRLAAHRSVYVWDMVGYGQSDKPDADVSLAAQGHLLVELVRSWDIEPPDVVAHDYGGAVALRAHLLHALDVRSLLLIDVVAVRPWGSPFFRLVAGNADVFTALPANIHAAVVREYVAGASSAGLAAEVLDNLVAPWLGEGQAAFYRQIAQADERFTEEFEPLLGRIEVPVLVVWGADDAWIPLDRAERLVRAIPGARASVIEGAGHLVQEDRPAELSAVVERWLGAPH